MPKLDPLPTPFISPGEPITARMLDRLARVASRQSPGVGGFVNGAFSLQAPITSEGGSTIIQGGGSTPVRIILLREDISGITEADPQDFVIAADIPLDEGEEGWTKVFQDPPHDDYDENHVDGDRLNLFRYRRKKVSAPVYKTTVVTGTAQSYSGEADEIKLASSASDEDDFYVGDTVAITAGTGEGQSGVVIDYDGATKVATLDVEFDPEADNTSEYSIVSNADMALDYEIINDEANDRKIVRYKYIDVWYDDRKPFKVGEYQKSDYPNYGENEVWPPEGLPEGFLNRKYRALVIGGVLDTRMCWPLLAPELPT